MFVHRILLVAFVVVLGLHGASYTVAQDADRVKQIIEQLGKVDHTVFDEGQAVDGIEPKRELSEYVKRRRRELNEQDVAAWREVKTREQWEALRDKRIAALKSSLGKLPQERGPLNTQVTKTLTGDGFIIECVVFETSQRMLVTANLYRPANARESMPGILICHSHHNPKTEGELQDMGMTWARQGCCVLVMDQLGHGERRQHQFRSASDFDKEFRASRQDYHFRFNSGIQLHLIGESLIGWMASDMMHGVDLLLGLPGIDAKRIALLGSVAGGGDPAAVTAAIDPRITAVVPFNFGGPQPESVFPLPEDAELSFNYVGGGSWESTRNLQGSGPGGFLPWVIVGSVAPRRLIYAHEFTWDKENDPVWKRLETIFGFYDHRDHLGSANGFGRVTLSSNEASHCNNIGGFHRQQIHPLFKTWFGIEVPDPEFNVRKDSSELWCVQDNKNAAHIELPPLTEVAGRAADERLAAFRKQLDASDSTAARIDLLRKAWRGVLNFKEPTSRGALGMQTVESGPIRTLSFTTSSAPNLHVPVLVLFPATIPKSGCPVVVGIEQSGKAGFLANRKTEIATLLAGGVAVALPDLRGTGETSPDTYRGRRSNATGLSSSTLMFGEPLLGSRLADLMQVIAVLRAQPSIDRNNVSLWGDSFAKDNSQRRIAVPMETDEEPSHSEPLGPALALLTALFDDEIKAVSASGGLISIRSVLDSPFVHVPHDFVAPGSLTAGDLSDIAQTITGRSVRLDWLVDGTNRPATQDAIEREYARASQAYAKANRASSFAVGEKGSAADWLLLQTRAK